MPLVLDATVGGLTANSYLDVPSAQGYLDATPNADAWTAAGTGLQAQALVAATTMLDALIYDGVKTAVGQALQWPRGGVLDPDYGDASGAYAGYMVAGWWGAYLDPHLIPKRIERACAALALEILRAGATEVWGVDVTANIAKKGIDVLTTEYVPVGQRRFGLRVYPQVWRWVYPLTLAAKGDRVERA